MVACGWRRVKADGGTRLGNRFDMERSSLYGGSVGPRSSAAAARAEIAHLVDQITTEFDRIDDTAGFRLGDVVGTRRATVP